MAIEIAKPARTGLSTFFDQTQLSFITTLLVFRHPTIKEPVQAISIGLSSKLEEEYSQTYEKQIERMIETYTSTTNPQQATTTPAKGGQLNIILIGSTGFLGRYLLENLVQRPKVARITCIDRNASAQQMHAKMLGSIQKKAHLDFETVALPDMSVEEIQKHKELYENTHGIIFSAWAVNFNQPLSFFEP